MHLPKLCLFFVFATSINANAQCVNSNSQRDFNAVGVVKNTDGEVIYEEHHSNDGVVSKVDYKNPSGEIIAEKMLDFDCLASAPNYVLNMKRDKWTEQVNWEDGQLMVTKPDGSKSLAVVSADDLVIDAGFDNYIFENWTTLVSGEQKQIDFLHVPGKRLIELVVDLMPDDKANEFTDSNNVAVFKITTKNKLLRLFAKPIYLGYDRVSKQLDFYSGPTNLRGAVAGLDKSRQIVINYSYN